MKLLRFLLVAFVTMANPNPPDFGQYLHQRFNMTAPFRAKLADQGLDSFDRIRDATEDDLDTIAATIRSPGGMIDNPLRAEYDNAVNAHNNWVPPQPPADADQAAIQAAADTPNPHPLPNPPGPPHQIRDPGYPITVQQTQYLKLLSYYLKHLKRTSRVFVNNGSNVPRLRVVYTFRQLERAYDSTQGPSEPVKMDKVSRIREIIEEVVQYLHAHRGTSGVILAYLIREDDEPAEGDPFDPADDDGVFSSFDDEMILRAPLTGIEYTMDNARLFQIWYNVLHDTESYSWIASFSRSQDGRRAHFAVTTHFLGDGHMQRLKNQADQVLENLFYLNEKPNFTFEDFASKMKRAHEDLAHCGEPLSESRKVRKLLKGIRATHLLSGPVPAIHSNPELMNNYDACITYIGNFITSYGSGRRSSQISSLTRSPHRGGRSDGRGRGRHNSGRGYRGGGRNSGRGSGGRYGGRNSGRGRNDQRRIRNDELHAGEYDDDTWYNVLTPTQRGRVMQMREATNTRQTSSTTTAPAPAPAPSPAPAPATADTVAATMTRRGGRAGR